MKKSEIRLPESSDERGSMESLIQYFKYYFTFKGRLNRKTYFLVMLKIHLMTFLYIISCALGAITLGQENKIIIILILIMFGFFMIMMSVQAICCLIKRLHDLNLSGYWWLLLIFLNLIPAFLHKIEGLSLLQSFVVETIAFFMGLVILVVCLFIFVIKGTEGKNKYGYDSLKKNDEPSSTSALLLTISPVVICLLVSVSIPSEKSFTTKLGEAVKGLEKLQSMQEAMKQGQETEDSLEEDNGSGEDNENDDGDDEI